MYKKLIKLDKSNNLKFSTKFSFLTLLFSLIPLLYIKLTSGYSSAMNFMMFANLISISYAFYLFRYKSGIVLSWIGYIKIGSLISFFNNIYYILPVIVFRIAGSEGIAFLIFIMPFIGIIFSVIAGIFFEKSPLKTKLKRLISIILFVWAIYNLFQSLLNKKDNSYGIDSDGDGIKDSFDTDGDGKIDCDVCDTSGEMECPECSGSGEIEDGGDMVICEECDGNGVVSCEECGGDGRMDCDNCRGGQETCDQCDGNGQIDTDSFDYERYFIVTWDQPIKERCELTEGQTEITMSEYDFDRLRDDFIKLKIDEKWDELSEWVKSNEIYCTYYNDNPKMYLTTGMYLDTSEDNIDAYT